MMMAADSLVLKPSGYCTGSPVCVCVCVNAASGRGVHAVHRFYIIDDV